MLDEELEFAVAHTASVFLPVVVAPGAVLTTATASSVVLLDTQAHIHTPVPREQRVSNEPEVGMAGRDGEIELFEQTGDLRSDGGVLHPKMHLLRAEWKSQRAEATSCMLGDMREERVHGSSDDDDGDNDNDNDDAARDTYNKKRAHEAYKDDEGSLPDDLERILRDTTRGMIHSTAGGA
eukprot:4559255-Prymnesium_polylepis.1